MSKPRSDSWLKNLPEDRQEQIIAWCNKPNDRDGDGKAIAGTGGYDYARKQIAADGISVSVRALQDFYSWARLKSVFARIDQKTADFQELLTQKFPDVDAKRIEDFASAYFTMEAAASGNAEEYREMKYLELAQQTAKTKGRQKEEELQLKRANFEMQSCRLFLKWFKDAKAREIADSNLSNADKIAAMREHFYADIEALAKSGEVQLPT